MAVKNDRWIRRMALEHDMINPFADRQIREGVISYGLSSYGYDLRVADEFKIFTNVNCTIVDPKQFDERSFVEFKGPGLHHSAQFVCPGALGGIFQDPAQRHDALRRQVHLRALRHHRQRHAPRTGVGRLSSRSKSPTPRRSPPASIPTKASARSFSSSPTNSAKSPTRTRKANTSPSRASSCRRFSRM